MGQRFPGPADTAVIDLPGTYTVTINSATTVASLTLGAAAGTQTLNTNGFTLTVDGPLAVNIGGDLLVTSGTLGGAGTLTNDGPVRSNGGTVQLPLINNALYDLRRRVCVPATGHCTKRRAARFLRSTCEVWSGSDLFVRRCLPGPGFACIVKRRGCRDDAV